MCARDFVTAGDDTGPPTRRAQLRAKMAAIRDRTSPPQNEALQDADVLAVITDHHKNAVDLAKNVVAWIRATRFISILLRTTQLAHVVMALTVVCVLSMFARNEHSLTLPSTITNAIYLTGFSAHLGAQFWMTFVSGLSLYFSLPRHAFGEVQKVLFPKYFLINSILSASTLVTFGRLNQALAWDMAKGVQVCALGICFLLELAVYLYAVPPLIMLINIKMALESKVPGVGQEVGRHDPGPLRNCPHYVAIHKQFRATHLTVAIANITAMACTAIHMHYLAQHYLSCH